MYGNQLPEVTISPVAIEIGTKAWQALLEEVYTTPKPGLVDTWSCGAHTDMDVHTFERSAEALRPYFIRMAEQGYTLQCSPKELFAEIRKTGILAEQAMYRATDGVNTHKGLIFTLGIFCAAAGRCAGSRRGCNSPWKHFYDYCVILYGTADDSRDLDGRTSQYQ